MTDDHNLKCNVLFLADLFEKFVCNSLKRNGLCLSHYLSDPASSCYAMLIMTKVKLELISDADMYLFFEKGMRGGVSYISKRYIKGNNNYFKSCDPKLKSFIRLCNVISSNKWIQMDRS